jgi:glycosyltransferase involved in cell wall biosynthesis
MRSVPSPSGQLERSGISCTTDPYLRPISNGVDLELFRPLDKIAARKEIAEISGDQRFLKMPIVGFCSRFEPGKGAYPFLRVAARNPNVLFPVIGQQFEPVTHPPNVIFLGPQPHDRMPLFYNALDILSALSVYSYESCPSNVLEGMACGLPVVAT